jgi:hypothetical protein
MHDYSPKEALDLVLNNIQTKSPQLYERMKLAIDAGKDVEIEEPQYGSGKKKPHIYRKNVPYSDEEALRIALTVLESHLIDSRKIVGATIAEFTGVAIAPAKPAGKSGADSEDIFQERTFDTNVIKKIVIESESETVQDKRNLSDFALEPIDPKLLAGLEALFAQLKKLTTFPEA